MATNARAELEIEIKALRQQIDKQARDEQLDKTAQDIKAVYDSFIRAGFTEEQAWELTKNIVNNGTAPKHSIF